MSEETLVPGNLTVAILSDLHAYQTCAEKDHAPSFYCIDEPIDYTPVGGLFKLIAQNALVADLVLCPGDLGDKACPAAIKEAWTRVNEVGDQLQAKLVAGTVGNHDVDSRSQFNNYDPIGFLQSLNPKFPLPNETHNDRFWSRHVTVVAKHPYYRLVVLDSSAFHKNGNNELEHGRVSPYMLEDLKSHLCEDDKEYHVNILLCHHHPHKHSEYKLGAYDEMEDGQILIEYLSTHIDGWVIVHGHKHHPKICYAHGGSNSPVIFSAGSLCHRLYSELSSVAQRQFYIIEFPLADIAQLGLVGTFRAWDWQIGSGWGPPARKSGLPGQGGFGYRTNLVNLAKEIADGVGDRILEWKEFLNNNPNFRYLLPSDAQLVLARLKTSHGIAVHYDSDETPHQIGRYTQ